MGGKKPFSQPARVQVVLTAAILLLAGCASVNPALTPQQMAADTLSAQTIAPGDVLEVKFLYNPELNDAPRVRPDGTIQLALLGDIKAAGKTPEQLQAELVKMYASQLKNPSLAVISKSSRNNKIYVSGEVNKPGEVEMPGRMTALEAIGQAGGFKMDTAQIKSVVLIRSKDGRHYGTALNFQDSLAGMETPPIYLQPGDVIFVPRTTIAKVNLFVEQYINKLLPKPPVSFSATP